MRLGARVVARMATGAVLQTAQRAQDVRWLVAESPKSADPIAGRRGLPPRQKYAVAPGDPVSQLLQTRRAGTLEVRHSGAGSPREGRVPAGPPERRLPATRQSANGTSIGMPSLATVVSLKISRASLTRSS